MKQYFSSINNNFLVNLQTPAKICLHFFIGTCRPTDFRWHLIQFAQSLQRHRFYTLGILLYGSNSLEPFLKTWDFFST